MSHPRRCPFALLFILAAASPAQGFTLEQVLAPPYPYELVSAAKADRIAWLAYERGMRNVYTAVAPDFAPRRLTSTESDDGIDLSSLRISADGAVLAFVRGHAPNREGWIANPTSDPRGGERAIWVIDTAGGPARRLARGSSPVLAPDGSRVLFERDGQIWSAAVRGAAQPQQLLRVFGDNRDPVWSPDSRRIAFVSDRDDHSYIAIYDLREQRVTYLEPGVDRDSSPTWSPDGRRVAFVRRPGLAFGQQAGRGTGSRRRGRPAEAAGEDEGRAVPGLLRGVFAGGHTLELWAADVETGEGAAFWRGPPERSPWSAIRRIEWAGEHVLFSLEPDDWRHWFSLPLAGAGEPVDLTPGEGLAEMVGISADGKRLYYSTNAGDIDRRHLWETPIGGGQPEQLTSGAGIETYPAPLASGQSVAFLSAGARQPQSVALLSADGGESRRLFPDLSEFPAARHVTPENVTLVAEDGLEFHNQVFVPRGIAAGERRPAVLFTHGGPRRQMLLGYHYRHFYHMAYAVNQYLADRGYVVISVNYRSGIGYGAQFRNAADRGRRGNSEYQDVLAAGRYLRERADVDPARIGLWGLSYGGLLTAQGLARNSDIFAAGVDMAGVHLWGSPDEPDGVAFRSSPVGAIEGWTSPVLLIHGDDDRNVAFSHTTGLVQLLRARGVPHELIVFPDDVHSSLLFSRWLRSFRAMDGFFHRHLGRQGQR